MKQRGKCGPVALLDETLEQLGAGARCLGLCLDHAMQMAYERADWRSGHRSRPPSGRVPIVVRAEGKRVSKLSRAPSEPSQWPFSTAMSAGLQQGILGDVQDRE